jgi:hypothetical protein
MVAVGDNIGIVIEDQERRVSFNLLHDIPAQEYPALGCEISGNGEPQAVALMRDDEIAPEAG